jgi:hypothetical protein
MLPERVVLFRAWITSAFDQDFAVADDPFVSEAMVLFGQVDSQFMEQIHSSIRRLIQNQTTIIG